MQAIGWRVHSQKPHPCDPYSKRFQTLRSIRNPVRKWFSFQIADDSGTNQEKRFS